MPPPIEACLVKCICISRHGHHWFRLGLAPKRRQAITWINVDLFSKGFWKLQWNFNQIRTVSFKKMHVKILVLFGPEYLKSAMQCGEQGPFILNPRGRALHRPFTRCSLGRALVWRTLGAVDKSNSLRDCPWKLRLRARGERASAAEYCLKWTGSQRKIRGDAEVVLDLNLLEREISFKRSYYFITHRIMALLFMFNC